MNNYISKVKISVAGEQGVVVDFGNVINAEINMLVQQLVDMLNDWVVDGIIEIVPTYRSVIIYFNPFVIKRSELITGIEEFLNQIGSGKAKLTESRVISVPVCYGGVFAPDMDFVVRHTGLSVQEVIDLHTSNRYLIYMLGFTPGFPYLGGLDDRLRVPRLKKERNTIPAGSVGIARGQTGLYTVESSGGWQLIGRTPIKAFYPERSNPFLFAAGDYLQFRSIGVDEFFEIFRAVNEGSYTPEITFSQ